MSNNNINITTKELKITPQLTPLILFTQLEEQPWAIWLDSCQSEHVDCRYDIIVWQPEITLTTHNKNTTIHDISNNSLSTSTKDPLLLLKKIQNQLFSDVTTEKNDLPFQGGALGYWSYDLGRQFETLPNNAINDINMPEMAVGLYFQAIIYDRQDQIFTLLCPENRRKNIEQWFDEKINVPSDFSTPSSNNSSKKLVPFSMTTDWLANMSRDDYQKKFEKIQQYLLSGDCYQINLAQRFSAKYKGEEFSAYVKLRNENQSPFSAFMRFDDSTILSVSPERFLKLRQGKVQSKPIKGTRARSENKIIDQQNAQDLKHAEKDRAENLMIVDLLRNDISKVCIPGSVTVPKLFDIESFPAVHHLVSTVEGKISPEYDATDLLRGAFPGGSITGAPKIRAMEIIDELEPHQRSVYCGSIGYISTCGAMDTSITIRTLVCKNNDIHCWAGGGLVADSQVMSEYQETYDKVKKILPLLTEL